MNLEALIASRPLNTVTRGQTSEAESSYLTLPLYTPKIPSKIPTEFKGQKIWEGLINPPLNQGSCGSCWAFASTGVLADRWNILTDGKTSVVLSPVKPILCDWQGEEDSLENPDSPFYQEDFWKFNQTGAKRGSCFGNTLTDAWRYLYVSGTTTLECLPYSLRGEYDTPLNEVTQERRIPLCYDVTGKIGDMCADNVYHSTTGLETGTPAKFYRAGAVYRIPTDPTNIQAEIMTNGPVTTGINIYPSFYTFDAVNDVYSSPGDEDLTGGHAVEIVGWGVHPNQGDFWWIKNSWGCYDKYTRVLTEFGWRYFHQLEIGDLVATLNSEREVEYHPVEEVQAYNISSIDPPLHHWVSDGIDLSVTHNHRILVPETEGEEKSYEFYESWNVMDSCISMYRSCQRFDGENPTVFYPEMFEEFLKVLTAFILDGYKRKQYFSEGIYDFITTMMEIEENSSIKYSIKLPKIRGLLSAVRTLGVNFINVNSKTIEIDDETLWNSLPKFGGRIPREVLNWSTEFLQPLFKSFFNKRQSITVNRVSLAGDIQELAMKSGSACTISITRGRLGNKYLLELCEPIANCSPCQLYTYIGPVFCVTVENHSLYVSRNGKAVWSGNSDWGEQGYFRIKRGVDEVGVESNVMAGLPDFFKPPTGSTKGIETAAAFRKRIDTGDHVAGGGIDPGSGYSRRVLRMEWPQPLDTNTAPHGARVGKMASLNRGAGRAQFGAERSQGVKPDSSDIIVYTILGIVFAAMWIAVLVWVLTRK